MTRTHALTIRSLAALAISIALVLVVSSQSPTFEKAFGAITVRVRPGSDERFAVTVTSGAGSTTTMLPRGVDRVRDAHQWNGQRVILTSSFGPLVTLSVIDVSSGQVLDNLFGNYQAALAPDGRRLAFDVGRSRIQSQSPVIALYDVGRPRESSRMRTATPDWEGFDGSGVAVYPTWNRIRESFLPNPDGELEHALHSPLVWISDDTLVFFDYANQTLTAVLIHAADIRNPNIRTAPVDGAPLINERGRRDFSHMPIARLPHVESITPISVRSNLARIKVTLRPGYWLTATEFEMEF